MDAVQKMISFFAKIMLFLGLSFAWIFLAPDSAHYVVLIMGMTLCFFGGKPLLRYREIHSWVESEGVLLRIDEVTEEVPDDHGPIVYYFPAVEYEYSLDGENYQGNKVSVEKQNVWITSEMSAWGIITPKWWGKLEAGDKVPVFINPNNPTESMLIKNLSKARRSHHLALVVSGIILMVIWFFL